MYPIIFYIASKMIQFIADILCHLGHRADQRALVGF